MAFCELRYFSPALEKQTAASIILPDDGRSMARFPVLYLLHGLSDDHTIWGRRTSVERYVAGLPLIVVMPDGGRGFYTDAEQGYAYETAIVRDLAGYVERMFAALPERSGRCIAGLSMGGYGAVRLALRHPDMFCAAVSHSGALHFGHHPMHGDDAWAAEMRRIVGADPMGGKDDLYALAERMDPALRPALRIDCGADDFLIEANRAFHAHLGAIGYAHEYAEFPGAHDWSYWDAHVREAIAFLARQLGIAERAPEGA